MVEVTMGSGNVFADLGFANPELEIFKARIGLEARRLRDILDDPNMGLYHRRAAIAYQALLWCLTDEVTKKVPKYLVGENYNLFPVIVKFPTASGEEPPSSIINQQKAYGVKDGDF